MIDQPFVSVIIVNYNGAEYLPACLEALQNQTYPQEKFELIILDNHSSDDSLSVLEQSGPRIKILRNERNLGFASGNNLAIDHSRGVYYILLNNDTAPHPEWLENLVKAAESQPDAGIITGHLRLFYDQLFINLHSDPCISQADGRELGVQIYQVDSGVNRGVFQYLTGFYGWELDPSGRKFRWSKADARIGIPVPVDQEGFILKLKIGAGRPPNQPVHIRLQIADLSEEYTLQGDQPVDIEVQIPDYIRSLAVPVEQNTGSIVSWAGQGRDRGTYALDNELFFETDQGNYGKIEEVFAGCGANMLLKKDMLAEVGHFDDDFFMYYEDTDLCWRARLLGWKILYSPDALVRHIHCGTTVEWSSEFIFLTERNRLAMVWKNGRSWQVARIWGGFIWNLLQLSMSSLAALVFRRSESRQLLGSLRLQLRTAWALFRWLPSLWQKRRSIQKRKVVPYEAIESWLVK